MKKTPIYSLIAIFIFSLVFQNQVPFQFAQAAAAPAQETAATSAVLVKVVSAAPLGKVIVAAQSYPTAVSLNCPTASQGGINLNEPANCFSLGIAKKSVVLPRVAVVALPALAVKIFVATPHLVLSAPDLLPGGSTSQIPVLPLTVFSLYIAFELSEKKIFGKIRALAGNSLKLNLNLAQLQVLRC